MQLRWFFKIFFLVIALGITIYSLVLLNTGHMNDFWTSLGIGHRDNSLHWCNNRLVTLTSSQQAAPWTLKEENRKWVVQKDNDTKILEYLDVEKWFAKYCIIEIEVFKDPSILDMKVVSIAKATFNDGTSANLFKLGEDGDLFQINHITFRSEEWKTALKELQDLLKVEI